LAINADLAASFYYSQQYDRSENQLENLLELNPSFIRARVILGKVWEQKGQHAKAIEMLRSALALSGNDPVTLSALAHALAIARKTGAANKILGELHELANQVYVSAGNFAAIYTGLGKIDLAFSWLEKAFENKDIEIVWLKVSPIFDPLRVDSRFSELIGRVSPVLLPS
ncbi:MAG TPA: tetratricopeptide repeat protein, partial [Pyrinomonadaceae bacterium]|nr:tetratricopeptide repeat protein [Pyrinomonadaceae bacterium]